jgi:hypothetical protein
MCELDWQTQDQQEKKQFEIILDENQCPINNSKIKNI